MITYQADGVALPDMDRRRVNEWIEAVVHMYGKRLGTVGYRFVDDERILDVNRQFLGHDYYTDIITFDYCHADVVRGDMVISLDTVRTNAEQFVPSYDATRFYSAYDQELHRVVIHGILHLCGLNDKGPGEREKMEAAEDKALQLLKPLNFLNL
ncbi:MAG: rRNA maturation RNase YbeY [Bacteroidaceae bacterium]|nr:rRNA maturation RNase YbeY [Bacteroidaceae bacterium]MBR4778868.1 rRNA maturation RNase YbeY [Bacteroidaceae bacterium]